MNDTTTFCAVDWQKAISDDDLDALATAGFLVLDAVFGKKSLAALRHESEVLAYQDAVLTGGVRLERLRGDKVRWIDDACPVGAAYLAAIEDLGRFFNRALYVGVCRVEGHYARYPSGFGYDWHKDNPKGRRDRVLSAVYYLNDDWQAEYGGALLLEDKNGAKRRIFPKADRLAIFASDALHKVEITARERASIAAWLRTDGDVFAS